MKTVNLKQRIIGAIVLIGLAIIFLPILLEEGRGPVIKLRQIPPRPDKPAVQLPSAMPAIKMQVPAVSVAAAPAWTLQLGAFANKSNADKLLARLQKAGYPAYAESQHGSAGVVMKIYIGPELDRNKLQDEADKLAKTLQIKGSIVSYKAIEKPMQASK